VEDFRITQMYPKVMTPNDASQNNCLYIFYDAPTGSNVENAIYDLRGARVKTLESNRLPMVWDGRDDNGRVVPIGIYVYRLATGGQALTGTVVIVR
jgi:flagellar hook assembly protein FlgD